MTGMGVRARVRACMLGRACCKVLAFHPFFWFLFASCSPTAFYRWCCLALASTRVPLTLPESDHISSLASSACICRLITHTSKSSWKTISKTHQVTQALWQRDEACGVEPSTLTVHYWAEFEEQPLYFLLVWNENGYIFKTSLFHFKPFIPLFEISPWMRWKHEQVYVTRLNQWELH